VSAKLYGLAASHPSHAARAMLKFKGIEHDLVGFPAFTHPIGLRAAGFRGRTVPALKIDGRRVQGSLEISRLLDEIQPDPPLFPADRREAVQEAEAWGEREFQPLPRRFFRWGLANNGDLRRWGFGEVAKMPAPGLTSVPLIPVLHYFARLSRATDENTRAGVASLPGALDHVDQLIAEGTIGRPGEPNAADFQIASTIAVLRNFADVKGELEGRPGTELAARLFPRDVPEVPPFMPSEWLTALRRRSEP
jgi:glutathione S-transferase